MKTEPESPPCYAGKSNNNKSKQKQQNKNKTKTQNEAKGEKMKEISF